MNNTKIETVDNTIVKDTCKKISKARGQIKKLYLAIHMLQGKKRQSGDGNRPSPFFDFSYEFTRPPLPAPAGSLKCCSMLSFRCGFRSCGQRAPSALTARL